MDFVNDYDKNILKYLKFDTKFKFKEKKFVPELMRNRKLNELFFETVPTTLRHEDLNCMEFSIENRSPFLDLDLFKFMNSVPSKKLIQKGYLKFILRETFKKIINKNIRENSSKIGFNASLNLFLKKEKKENLKKFFLQDKVMKKFVDMKKIYLLVLKENRGSQIDKFLFNVINIKIFLENHKIKKL